MYSAKCKVQSVGCKMYIVRWEVQSVDSGM